MKNEEKHLENSSQEMKDKHSLVCNDQLFYQELKIAAEQAEGQDENDNNRNSR